MNTDPVYICGMQRSGTSLMRAIVGSHPDVAIFEWDLMLWTGYYDRFKDRDLSNLDTRRELLDTIFDDDRVKRCDVPLRRDAVARSVAEADSTTCGEVFRCFLEEYARAAGRPRWGIKTPHNEFYVEAIFAAHPNARFVHLIRDPRDVAVSYRSYDGGAWAYKAGEHIEKWRQSVALAGRYTEVHRGRYQAIRYESLVTDPETSIRHVCGTLCLDFDLRMIEAAGHPGWQGSNSFFSDVGKRSNAISTAGIGRYKTQLPLDLIYRYQRQLRPELDRLGYELQPLSLGRRALFRTRQIAERARYG